MYAFLDFTLTVVHLLVICFNLFGWVWSRSRRLHLLVSGLTAASWLVLGIWYGLGYCPITDWQWQVKGHLGEQNLPASFITYWLNTVWRLNLPESLIDAGTAIGFFLALASSLYLYFSGRKT
ncbi:DUF2784 domain-containing protein [Pedobacter yulinensis]|uniref:DUF2784 domain-containing protein n=1 Tax=Pedobacter yulinensis TaxID=2126353 RepID=A0A2T3HLE3_9SPHI|nr:DUF2784 domain-containing protein [Pedobacter yulinensis]PST83211.1 DUF2784 domain-containing protein [Pedobacter yulinensis]